jgi:hypothetical protein
MAKRKGSRVRSQLEQHIQTKELVTIRRDRIDPHGMSVVVLAMSEDLALLQYTYDFFSDGFMIVRVSDITQVRCGAGDKWYEHILRSEWVVSTIAAPFAIDLQDWKTAVDAINRQWRNIIVEDETAMDSLLFVIGKTISLGYDTLSIRGFDCEGYWDNDCTRFPYSRITAVTFDCNYVNLHSKYVRERE